MALEAIKDPTEPEIPGGERWYGFDTENDSAGNVTLTALVGEDGKRKIWKGAGCLIKWMDTLNESDEVIIVCHNLEYDLVNEFGDNYAYLNLNYLKGRLISAVCGPVKFVDSFNHYRMSLAELGAALSIEKMEMDIYDEEYVANDAYISLMAMVRARDYIASVGGKIGATSGSSSVSVWRSMTDDEFVYGSLDSKWLRRGYYGGRTELFRKQARGDIYAYDINSMYPYCMKN